MKNGDQLLCSIAENTSATENWKGDKAHKLFNPSIKFHYLIGVGNLFNNFWHLFF